VNVLAELVASTREGVEGRRSTVPLGTLRRACAERSERPRGFRAALARPGLSVIAEHKRRSPSAGAIREDLSLEEVVGAYQRGGAAALSVLTEETRFGGSLSDLRAARLVSSLPILRKDFVVEDYQLYEAAAGGADAVLLIVAALSDAELARLRGLARELGLDALVEVHDAAELERAAALGADLVGINNRDLTTLEVDRRRTFALLAGVPDGAVVVAESGFSTRAELDELAGAGVDAVLIGEALMRAADIEGTCRALTTMST
jgi:indole-3-glycerol phosphate synthase